MTDRTNERTRERKTTQPRITIITIKRIIRAIEVVAEANIKAVVVGKRNKLKSLLTVQQPVVCFDRIDKSFSLFRFSKRTRRSSNKNDGTQHFGRN
jgi:hypothetical protein